jgi:uncharacterized protein with PIN domain
LSEFEEKILNLLEKIDEKLDRLLDTKKSEGVGTKAVASTGEGYVKPSAVVEKQEEEQKAIEKPPVEGRRVCPACGGTTFNTEEDKTQVLFQQGGMKIYAKRYICKSCGTEA